MTPGSLSPLQLDPLGGLTARLITVSCVAIGLGVAVAMSLAYWSEVSSTVLQLLALLVLGAACTLMVISTNPYRVPLGRGRMASIWSILAVAATLDLLSQWGTNTSIRNDWGPLAFAVVVLMSGSYRPAREILRLTLGATCFLLAIAAIEIAPIYADDPARFLLSPVVYATPVLATGIAAAAFSRTLVVHLLAWRRSAASAQRDVIDDLRTGLVSSVRGDRIELLNGEVVPFLQRIVELGELRAEDSDRARELAEGLRSIMAPESGRNWLESVADEVVDPEQLAERMGNEQRGSLKALLSALQDAERSRNGPVSVRVRSQETIAYLQLTAPVSDAASLRHALAPYFVVARSFFPRAVLEIDRGELTLELHFALG